jgi:hypothetical protein
MHLLPPCLLSHCKFTCKHGRVRPPGSAGHVGPPRLRRAVRVAAAVEAGPGRAGRLPSRRAGIAAACRGPDRLRPGRGSPTNQGAAQADDAHDDSDGSAPQARQGPARQAGSHGSPPQGEQSLRITSRRSARPAGSSRSESSGSPIRRCSQCSGPGPRRVAWLGGWGGG